MAQRTYAQYCGLAHALDLIGERWALLVVRDLMLGPKRFTDLTNGLAGIPTNVLSTRLKELEASGIIARRLLPRPEGSVVYELTDYGRELDDVLMRLGLWGARSIGDPREGDALTPIALILALHGTFRPENAGDTDARFVLCVGESVVHAHVHDGAVDLGEGEIDGADVVIHAGPAFRRILAGELPVRDALADGSLQIAGSRKLLDRFVELFRFPESVAV